MIGLSYSNLHISSFSIRNIDEQETVQVCMTHSFLRGQSKKHRVEKISIKSLINLVPNRVGTQNVELNIM